MKPRRFFKSLMILEELLAVTDSAAASGLGTPVGKPTVPVQSDDVMDELWETVAMVPVEKASPKSRKKRDAQSDQREGARHLHFIAHAFTRILGETFLANHTQRFGVVHWSEAPPVGFQLRHRSNSL